MADDLGAKIQTAKQAGYSDDDIITHLAQSDERVKTAIGAGYKPAEIISHLTAAAPAGEQKTWSGKMGLVNPMARGFVDTLEGAAAGAASTVFHGGDLLRRATGMERVIDKPEVKQAMAAPPNAAGTIGKFAEQAAEYAIPSSLVAKGAKGLSTVAKMAAQATTAAGVSGAQTGGDPGSMATAAILGAAGEAIPAVMNAGKGVVNALKESAAKEYGQVINATKQGNKWLSQNVVVPELIDRGVTAFTLKGLFQKASERAAFYGSAIGDAWKGLPAGSKIDLAPIISNMTKQAEEALTMSAAATTTTKQAATPLQTALGLKPTASTATVAGKNIPTTTYAKDALAQMEFLKKTLTAVAERNPVTKVLEVPVEKLRMLRQAWDEVAANSQVFQGKQLADHAAGKVHAMASDSIREVLAQEFPTISALNKEYSFWKNVQKVVGDTVLRREGQAKPMSQQIAAAAGTAVGGSSGGIHGAIAGKMVIEGLQKVMSSPAWRTVSAVMKDRLADAIAAGNRGTASMIVVKMLKSAGLEGATKAVEAPAQSSEAKLLPQAP